MQIFWKTFRIKTKNLHWYSVWFTIVNSFINQIEKEVIMTLVKRNGNLQHHFPTLFDDFLNRDIFNWGLSNFSDTNTTIPAVNIKETADNYEVEVAAPGMSKKDFKVVLEGNILTISSEKMGPQEQKQTNEVRSCRLSPVAPVHPARRTRPSHRICLRQFPQRGVHKQGEN